MNVLEIEWIWVDPRRIRGESAANPRRIRGKSAADPRRIRGGSAVDPRLDKIQVLFFRIVIKSSFDHQNKCP